MQTQRCCKNQGRNSNNLISENLISENHRTLNQLVLKLLKEKDWTTEPSVKPTNVNQ